MQFSLHKGVISSKFVCRMSKTVLLVNSVPNRPAGGCPVLPSTRQTYPRLSWTASNPQLHYAIPIGYSNCTTLSLPGTACELRSLVGIRATHCISAFVGMVPTYHTHTHRCRNL